MVHFLSILLYFGYIVVYFGVLWYIIVVYYGFFMVHEDILGSIMECFLVSFSF